MIIIWKVKNMIISIKSYFHGLVVLFCNIVKYIFIYVDFLNILKYILKHVIFQYYAMKSNNFLLLIIDLHHIHNSIY
jgi:hypothetical protein